MTGVIATLIDTLRLGGRTTEDLSARWRGADTAGLASLVVYEGAAVWLYRRLRAIGAMDALPDEFAAELKRQATVTAALGIHIEEAAVEALGILGQAGIPVVLIKGMARRALAERYPYLDARPTGDVDLLLPEAQVHEAFGLLQSAGYIEAKPGCAVHHHLPPLWNERRVAVELHWTTSRWVRSATAWERAATEGLEVEWRGFRVRTPCPTELAWDAAYHAVTPAESIVVGFRLQHFLEVAALEAGGAAIDWETLWRRAEEEMVADVESDQTLPPHLIRGWMDSARALGSPDRNRCGAEALDLAGLLGWRLMVLRSRERLGRALVGRLMEEGPRALIGAPIEASPPHTAWPRRLRRRTAAIGSRLLLRTWRVAFGP